MTTGKRKIKNIKKDRERERERKRGEREEREKEKERRERQTDRVSGRQTDREISKRATKKEPISPEAMTAFQ